MRTRNQIYADAAWQAIKTLDASGHTEFKRWADSFPAHVMKAGLAQAIGFVRAKANGKKEGQATAAKLYLSALRQMTTQNLSEGAEAIHPKDSQDEMQSVREWHAHILREELRLYMQSTQRILQAAVWLKRIGQTELKDTEPNTDDTRAQQNQGESA
jgi:CRISPR type III-B/RAMP module-associated protein Cmr5